MSAPTRTGPIATSGREEYGAPALPLPGLSGKGNNVAGNLVKGPIDEDGKLKSAALLVGVKLDLEAEVHLSARVRGDIVVGLY